MAINLPRRLLSMASSEPDSQKSTTTSAAATTAMPIMVMLARYSSRGVTTGVCRRHAKAPFAVLGSLLLLRGIRRPDSHPAPPQPAPLLLAFAGAALLVLCRDNALPIPTASMRALSTGMALAALAAAASAMLVPSRFAGARFAEALEQAGAISPAERGSAELAGALAIRIPSLAPALIALPLLSYSTGEQIETVPLLSAATAGVLIGVPTAVLFRYGVLAAKNAAILAPATYIGPPLALAWLLLAGRVDVARLDLLVVATAGIACANLMASGAAPRPRAGGAALTGTWCAIAIWQLLAG